MSIPKGEKASYSFTERIKELIGDGAVSAFARSVGLKQAAIDRYVKGLREPNADALRKISNACGVTTDWLLGVSSSPNGVADSDLQRRCTDAEKELQKYKTAFAKITKSLKSTVEVIEELQEAVK